jgi:hypothetical protein
MLDVIVPGATGAMHGFFSRDGLDPDEPQPQPAA